MNEDLRPCYDIESDWELVDRALIKDKIIFRHKDCPSLYRIIDYRDRSYEFNDSERVIPKGIIDINRKLPMDVKLKHMGLVLRIIHEEKPISLPYIHEELKVYVQYANSAIGLLYYKDNDEEQSIVPIKRFFKIGKAPEKEAYEEITWTEFYELTKEDEENA